MLQSRQKKTLDVASFCYQSPIILTPKSRAGIDITHDGSSWFGGLPRLADQSWPQSRDGSLMHLAAQIDLSELSHIETPLGFPKSGSLAFFVDIVEWPYTGAVVYVPNPGDVETQPIEPLPRLFRQSQSSERYSMEGYATENAPRTFPRWPLDFLPLDVVEDIEDYEDVSVLSELATHYAKVGSVNSIFDSNYRKSVPEFWEPRFWDTAQRFANLVTNSVPFIEQDMVHDAKDEASWPDVLAELLQTRDQIKNMVPNPDETQENFEQRRTKVAADHEYKYKHRTDLNERSALNRAFKRDNLDEFLNFEAEVRDWAHTKQPWDEMLESDIERLEFLISKVTKEGVYPQPGLHLFMSARPNMDDFMSQTLEAQLGAPDAAYSLLPADTRQLFETNGHIAYMCEVSSDHHQMFGFAQTVQGYEDYPEDYLLLKLGNGRIPGWRWGEQNAYFWISPDDLLHGRWENVSIVIGHE